MISHENRKLAYSAGLMHCTGTPFLVETVGVEPMTSRMRTERSTN